MVFELSALVLRLYEAGATGKSLISSSPPFHASPAITTVLYASFMLTGRVQVVKLIEVSYSSLIYLGIHPLESKNRQGTSVILKAAETQRKPGDFSGLEKRNSDEAVVELYEKAMYYIKRDVQHRLSLKFHPSCFTDSLFESSSCMGRLAQHLSSSQLYNICKKNEA